MNPISGAARRVIIAALITFTVIAAVAMGWHQWNRANQAAAKTRVERAGGASATQSAKDAIATIGGASSREISIDQTGRENENAIRKADGASAPVAAGVHGAGLVSMCRHAAYRRDTDCLRFTPAK